MPPQQTNGIQGAVSATPYPAGSDPQGIPPVPVSGVPIGGALQQVAQQVYAQPQPAAQQMPPAVAAPVSQPAQQYVAQAPQAIPAQPMMPPQPQAVAPVPAPGDVSPLADFVMHQQAAIAPQMQAQAPAPDTPTPTIYSSNTRAVWRERRHAKAFNVLVAVLVGVVIVVALLVWHQLSNSLDVRNLPFSPFHTV